MNNLVRITNALEFIDARDRETWLRMGMAIKSEIGEEGFNLWVTWSQQADSFNYKDARVVWKSILARGKVTIRTLFHEAKANGWRDEGTYLKQTSEVLSERRRIAEERALQEKDEIARERVDTAKKAAAILKVATEAKADHPYLIRKKILPVATLREIEVGSVRPILGYYPKSGDNLLSGRLLVVPVKQGDSISTLELIDESGRKAALAGRGSKVGGYWANERLPETGKGLTLLIGEGVATMLSAKQTTGYPCIAALSSSNLVAVAKSMSERYPEANLVILADLVKATGEPDRHAIEAARSVGAELAIPNFGSDRDSSMTDFNDMLAIYGPEVVKCAIANAMKPVMSECELGNESASVSDSISWQAPHSLTAKVESEPYPVEALPDAIRLAVEEVASFVKAPISMIASSALAALSLAAQAHIDVKRAERLQGPVGLFLLTIADSGERKTTCDNYFVSAIQQYQNKQTVAMEPKVEKYQAELEGWKAEIDGIRSAIKNAAKSGKATNELKERLVEVQRNKPKKPRVPRLILGDETPENLAWSLAMEWPSAGLISSEAGIVFGAHGMGKDSVMRNLSLLNVLWDGGSHSVGRRTSESFTVKGARLTVALQVQEPTLREFFTRSGALARGTGFLARFLVAWPESNQGHRPFTEAPTDWPHLTAFNQRIAAILNQPIPMDEKGVLNPTISSMTLDAKTAWEEYHNDIESQLQSGGEFYEVRDVASKSADNAARLAALFQMFDDEGVVRAIGIESFERASLIAAWHLHEARRFFGELALPAELADAVMLDNWLIKHCMRERTHFVSSRDAQRLGPVRVREKLATALQVLEEMSRVRVRQEGRRKTVLVNPILLELTS